MSGALQDPADAPPSQLHVDVQDLQVCHVCDKAIPRKGMNAHRHSAHGLKSNMRRYVVGTTCTVCQKEFHTRYRHFRHVSHDSKRCGESLMQLGAPPLSQEQCDELDKADLTSRQAHRRAGTLALQAFLPAYRRE